MEELFNIILDKLKTIPLIKSAKIFNNQIMNIENEKVIAFPVVYVELANVKSLSRPYLETQDCSAILRLRVVHKSDTQESSAKVYKIKDQVHQYMNRFNGEGKFQPIHRVGEILSYNHGNIYEYQIEYSLNWKDYTPPVTHDTPVGGVSLDLQTDLDIDNPIIRTGDNKGYVFN